MAVETMTALPYSSAFLIFDPSHSTQQRTYRWFGQFAQGTEPEGPQVELPADKKEKIEDHRRA